MMKIADVMTRSVVSVQRSTPLRDVAQTLIDHRVSGVPVVDPDGSLVGVVTEADLLIKEQGPDAIQHRRFARFLGESAETRGQITKQAAVTAADAMTAPVRAPDAMTAPAFTIGPNRPIHEAAAMMTRLGVNRLPVVDAGRVVGIVSRADLVRAYVRSDAELTETIKNDVILRILWLDPAQFTVVVDGGIATVEGHVERRSMAEMIERTVSMVPGIVGVRVSVTWVTDDRRVEPVALDPVFPFSPR